MDQSEIIKQLLDRVTALESIVDRHAYNRRPRVFVATRDGQEFQEQTVVEGEFEDADPDTSRRCTDDTDTAAIITPESDKVILLEVTDGNDGTPCSRFVEVSGGGNVRWVDLTSDGGDNGDDDEPADYTYTATDTITAEELGTGLSPWFNRPNGAVNVAEHGVGFYDDEGEFVLAIIDETPMDDVCEPEA